MNTPADFWMTLLLPPDRYETVEVRLSDDSVKPAIWTGAQWWCDGRQVVPKAWRPLQSAFAEAFALRSA